MNFDDTPQEAAFRAEAKAWIAANAPKQYEEELRKVLARPHRAQGRQHPRGRKSLAEEEGRCRLGLPALAEGIWRPRLVADRARDLAAGRGPVRQALRHVHHRPRHVRADHDGVRRRRAEAQIPAAAGLGRKGLVSVVLRTRRRFRRRGPAHPRREEGRRLDHQRPEDLDLGRALFGLRHPADAHRSRTSPSTRASPCSSWT